MILCSTSTLSILSSAISKVRRLMKPVLCTTRWLVTSVSVVKRWNQPLTVQNNAATAITAAEAQHQGRDRCRHKGPDQEDAHHDPGADRRQIEYPMRVGRIQHLFAGLQDLVDIARHQTEPPTPTRQTAILAGNRLAAARFAMYTRLSSRMPLLLGGPTNLSLVDH